MTNGRAFDVPTHCQIKVKGHVEDRWADWFDGFTIQRQPGLQTVLCGKVADQAALHGILAKILDLGLPLLSLRCACTPSGAKTKGTDPGDIGRATGDETTRC